MSSHKSGCLGSADKNFPWSALPLLSRYTSFWVFLERSPICFESLLLVSIASVTESMNSKKRKPPSLGGLEPPTFRLTAERANRLRHRDIGAPQTFWKSHPGQRHYSQMAFRATKIKQTLQKPLRAPSDSLTFSKWLYLTTPWWMAPQRLSFH